MKKFRSDWVCEKYHDCRINCNDTCQRSRNHLAYAESVKSFGHILNGSDLKNDSNIQINIIDENGQQ